MSVRIYCCRCESHTEPPPTTFVTCSHCGARLYLCMECEGKPYVCKCRGGQETEWIDSPIADQ